MTRQQANKEILKILERTVHKYPNLRFEQILYGLGLEWTSFEEESVDTLELISENERSINEQH